MPRADKKQQTRESILRVAANILRREGVAAASVSHVMRGAGLTVGGFYAHFETKSHMAAEALLRAFSENMGAMFEGLDTLPTGARYSLAIRRYLSRQHRDMEHETCPVPACLSEIEPGDAPLRDALVDGIEALVAHLEPLAPPTSGSPRQTARQRALADAATLIGAMALARATRGTPWSDEILLAARRALLPLDDGEHLP